LLTTKQQHNEQDLNITNEPETYVLRENQIQDQISFREAPNHEERELFFFEEASNPSMVLEKLHKY